MIFKLYDFEDFVFIFLSKWYGPVCVCMLLKILNESYLVKKLFAL